jgi:hypothetical protein
VWKDKVTKRGYRQIIVGFLNKRLTNLYFMVFRIVMYSGQHEMIFARRSGSSCVRLGLSSIVAISPLVRLSVGEIGLAAVAFNLVNAMGGWLLNATVR